MQKTAVDLPEILSVEQTAAFLHVCKQTVYNWCSTNNIPSFKIGNTRRFRKSVILDWISNQEKENE